MDFGRAYASDLWLIATNPTRKKNLDRDYYDILKQLLQEPEHAVSLQVFGTLFRGFSIWLRERLYRALRNADAAIQRILRKGHEEKKQRKDPLQRKANHVHVV